MKERSTSRRKFLQSSATLAGVASTPYFFSSTHAQEAKSKSPNDRPILGCIGTGDRWNGVGPQALGFADCVAVCDVDADHAKKGKDKVDDVQKKAGRERKVEIYEDYRKLLDRKDIDVVTIVTPDHWHSKIAIEAMKAGKDVYCEKPLTLTIDEGKQILKVLKETNRVFQVGTQQRSEMSTKDKKHKQQFLTAVALCHAGRLGKIRRVECRIGTAPTCSALPKAPVPSGLNWDMWLGQAPMTDYVMAPSKDEKSKRPHSRVHYEFRWWYEYSGGKMTDWGAHHVDIASWAIGVDKSGPASVEGIFAKHPCEFKNGMPTRSDMYNVASQFDVKCVYANDIELHILSDGKNGILISGDKGDLFVSRDSLYGSVVDELADKPLPEDAIKKLYKGKTPGSHMGNFFECIATREQPISDVSTHHRAMTTCHLANIAIRLGRKINWDAATEQIIGDEEANAMQKREARKGYEVQA